MAPSIYYEIVTDIKGNYEARVKYIFLYIFIFLIFMFYDVNVIFFLKNN